MIPAVRERPGRAARSRGMTTFGMGGDAAAGYADVPQLAMPTAGTPNATGTANATVFVSGITLGTLYWGCVTNGGSATNAQLIAGSGGNLVAASCGNQAVTNVGVQTVAAIAGLTTATTYQILYLVKAVNGQVSSQAKVTLITT